MKTKWWCFLVVLVFNVWIWKILFINFLLGLLLILVALALFFWTFFSKKPPTIFIVGLLTVLLVSQIVTTSQTSLTILDNDQQRVVSMRLKEEKPVHIPLGSKNIWLNPAFLENSPAIIAWARIQNNIFENLDINQFFYAGHPRERIGIVEFEKFPFLFFPFLLMGFYFFVKNKQFKFLNFFIGLILIVSIWGNQNNFGALVVFPFFVITITAGLSRFLKYLDDKRFKWKLVIVSGVFCCLLLNFIQTIAYAT